MNVASLLEPMRRRFGWLLHDATPRKLANMALAAVQFAGRSQSVLAWPIVLKIDITPLCNLRCTLCVHAAPHGNPALARQKFDSSQRMTLGQFTRIVAELKGRAAAVSLFYLGDPLMHPQLDDLCRIARNAGLNVHITSNFSFALSDTRLRRLVTSGLTHLTVCVDGLSQACYERTRVGGRIDWVMSNLRRLCAFRRESGRAYPRVEVQFLRYQHNLAEREEAMRLFRELGVDQVTSQWGLLHNYTDQDPGTYAVGAPRRAGLFPQCWLPYLTMLIKYNGDVIPCCLHRCGLQYAGTTEARVIGNVFATSIQEVWNSPAYRAVRRLVANPQSIRSDRSLEDSFCFACSSLFETDMDRNLRPGDRYTFEDLYTIAEDGTPARKDYQLA
jgi:MoaA/NifB/PqqE/SkfB family radical SAM enzyme